MIDFILTVQEYVEGTPELLQWLAIALASAIPFVESYFGSAIGVIVGMSPFIAVPAAIVGNGISMLGFVEAASRTKQKIRGDKEQSARQKKIARMLDKFGVAGVSILGQTFLPSQLTSAGLIGLGASKRSVIIWQTISIILWGVVFGILASIGVDVIEG